MNKGNFTAKLIILLYDYFGENHTPLVWTGMAAIPKKVARPAVEITIVLHR